MDKGEWRTDNDRSKYTLTTLAAQPFDPAENVAGSSAYTTFTPDKLTSWEYNIHTTSGYNCKAVLAEVPDVDLSGLAKTVYQESRESQWARTDAP